MLARLSAATPLVIGLRHVVAGGDGRCSRIEALVGILWNVITVSLRQTIIPPHLLGRVNSVYRFFAWGMMPIGAALGGVTVAIVATFADREMALRATWIADVAAIHVGLFVFGRAKLTTEKIEAARAAGASQSAS